MTSTSHELCCAYTEKNKRTNTLKREEEEEKKKARDLSFFPPTVIRSWNFSRSFLTSVASSTMDGRMGFGKLKVKGKMSRKKQSGSVPIRRVFHRATICCSPLPPPPTHRDVDLAPPLCMLAQHAFPHWFSSPFLPSSTSSISLFN